MKKIIYYSALLLSFNLLAQTPPQPEYETITDLTFTDIDGETHNLYSLIGEGYRVILDFGFIGCGPCAEWSEYVGPVIWEQYGPDGDNSLRMFHFETGGGYEDDFVDSYYTNLGVEYPVITTIFHPDSIEPQYQALFDADILDGSYPVHVYVCQDTTYRSDQHQSLSPIVAAHILDHSCNGQDLFVKDVELKGLSREFSYCSENSSSTLTYTPRLEVHHNGILIFNSNFPEPNPVDCNINDIFYIKSYINNTYLRTDTLDPTDWSNSGGNLDSTVTGPSDDEYGQGPLWHLELPSMQVEVNDSVKFELFYPEDSYLLNNTASFKVETDEAKTASSNLLRLVFGHYLMSVHLCVEGEEGQAGFEGQQISIANGLDTLLTINNGQCYAMSFLGANLADAYLIQSNNNDTLFSHKKNAQTFESKYFYFNVDSTASSVEEQTFLPKRLSNVLYYDILGKLQKEKEFSDLPNGIYLRVAYYTDGTFTSDKIAKLIY